MVVTGAIVVVPYFFPRASQNSAKSQLIPLLSLALVVWKTALIDCAYSLASLQLTSLLGSKEGSSRRSVLFPTTASRTSFEELFITSSAHSFIQLKDKTSATSYTSTATRASLQYIFAMARYFSCPAVSHICNRYDLPGVYSKTRSMKLAPRVAGDRELYSLLTKRWLMLVLPTPDTPTTTTFILGISTMRLPTELNDSFPEYYIRNITIDPKSASQLRAQIGEIGISKGEGQVRDRGQRGKK